MTTPPRVVESLLEGLGAGTRFSEPLLGDLAEELALRAERDGVDAARWWYRREALRAAPHLLGAWWRRLDGTDVRRLANVVLLSYVIMLGVAFLAGGMALGVAHALGIALPTIAPGHPLTLAVFGLLGLVQTTFGGYVAGWLDREAPLASALAVGVVWATVNFVAGCIAGPEQSPWWLRLSAPVLLFGSAAIGGLLRARRQRVVVI